jgi:RNA polymerase sigma factor (sigma-70 family)
MKSPPDIAQGTTPESRFTEMYTEHYAEVLRFVRRRAHPLNVDDVVSDTFTAAWLRRADLPTPVLPWLYRTARNVMLNTDRGGNRQRAVAVRLAGESARASTSGIDELEQRLDLELMFRSLTERDQELLALDVWEQLSARDAAAVLGCTRAAYSMRLTRARRRLATLLRVDDPIPLPHEPLEGSKASAY